MARQAYNVTRKTPIWHSINFRRALIASQSNFQILLKKGCMRFNVITIKWGKRYGPEYVNRLYGSVERNLSREFRFVCFTDDAEYIRPEVETYPIPNGINPSAIAHFSHGKKQQLFHSGVGDLTGTSLYFDLDVIIVDSIDCFFDFKPGELCVCREWLPPTRDCSTN